MPTCSRTSVLVLAVGLCSPSAWAYRTGGDLAAIDSEAPVRWPASTLSFELSSEQLPAELDIDEVAAEALASFQTWQDPACAELLVEHARNTEDVAVLGDGRNTVQFVSEGWADRGYLPDQAGVTELDYARVDDGEWFVAEADLFINAEDFTWSVGDEARPLSSLFVHEGGHMLGLLHPCEEGLEDVPECGDGDFETSAMYPFYDATQISLNEDDVAAICFLYPECADPSCAGTPCAQDSECEEGEECSEEGACIVRLRELGEDCSTADDCSSGFCNDGDVCGTRPGEFGADCVEASDCVSNQCLAGVEETSVCTELCNTSATCSEGWTCTPVEDRKVCAPPDLRATGGGGCAVAPLTAPAGGVSWLLAALFSLSLCRTRRLRPKSDPVSTSRQMKSERSS